MPALLVALNVMLYLPGTWLSMLQASKTGTALELPDGVNLQVGRQAHTVSNI